MRLKIIIASVVLASISFLCAAADSPSNSAPTTPVAQSSEQANAMRLEGEKRFRANCGRCHAAPHKFPPRMMATILRHMRVRATITDEDMHLVLFYMTQ
jgi:cytochrome c5